MDKILILGGTNFIGRNLVDKLVQLNKFDITLFHRGQTNPNLYPDLKVIYGDRNTSDINLIFNKNWDYIIDLSCYFPNSLHSIIPQLDQSLKRYIFISTCSVYDNDRLKSVLRGEDSPILDCTDAESIDSSVTTYGQRKARCERILRQSNLRYSIFRPALVYGEYDHSDRFYYWLYQVKKGGKSLIPNQGENLFSVTYVKDLVQVIIKSLTIDLVSDIYTVTTFPKLSISKLVRVISEISGNRPALYSANSAFLTDNKIEQWTDLPLWLACDYYTYDNAKILRDMNLEITDFRESVAASLAYYDTLNWEKPTYGLSEMKKNELIELLK